eukprot:12881174-Alexandrium_andersonii.AAC.1
MSASLVGSEMCIRDSLKPARSWKTKKHCHLRPRQQGASRRHHDRPPAVSYTHLTLPTICSV